MLYTPISFGSKNKLTIIAKDLPEKKTNNEFK